VSEVGQVQHFIVHARKAVLNAKFSPDMNRRIPPLKYDYVYNLVKEFPHLQARELLLMFQIAAVSLV
jgi:tRNA-dihydrouridine synthase A